MDNLNFSNRLKRGFIPFVTAAIMVISLFAAMPATAQFIITGSAPASFSCTLGVTTIASNTDIGSVLDAIRTHANGANPTPIQFGSGGTNVLNIGSSLMLFSSGLSPAWGNVTLTGRVTSSSTGVVFETNIASLGSEAYIENTGTGNAIRHSGTGTLYIDGGEVKAASGRAIYNSSTGDVYISGGTVTSTNTTDGTIYLAGSGTATTNRLEIAGGTVSNTSTGNAVYNASTGGILIRNGATVQANSGAAIWNNNTGLVSITGSGTMVTSANTSATAGTIYLASSGTATTNRLEISGGTVRNTDNSTTTRGKAVYNQSTGAIEITGGTVQADRGAAIWSFGTGFINISGSGALVTSNNNDYSSQATIVLNNNSSSTAQYLNISGGSVTNPSGAAIGNNSLGSVRIQSGATVSGQRGAVSNYGGGTVNISGGSVSTTSYDGAVNNYGGGTVNISGGTVQATASSSVAVWSGSSSTGQVNITGGTVTSANTSATQGTILLSNTGDTGTQLTITNGTISNSASGGNMIYTVAPTVRFNITSGNTYEFYGAIAGAGNVDKTGNGELTMRNNCNNATGTFALTAGTTILEGNWGGNLYQLSGSTLIVGVNNLSIGGNYTQYSGSTFNLYENLNVGGNLSLNGGTLGMTFSSGTSRITATGTCSTSGTTTINLGSLTPANQVLISAASGLGSTTPFALNIVTGPTGSLTANGTQLMFSAPVTPPTLITAAGLTAAAPVAGATPSTTITTGSTEFTAALAWDGSPATFGYSTAYTATITLTAETGYTFTGDYTNTAGIAGFTVNGAAPTTWTSNGGTTLVFKYTFPATGAAPTLATLTVGLTPGNGQVTVAPQTAEAGYAFYYNSSSATVAAPAYGAAIGTISGATAYTTPTDITGANGTAIFVQIYKVETGGNTVVGFGEASATPTATPPTLVTAAGLTVTAPVAGATPSTTITTGSTEFTAALAWDGSPATFGYSTAYTATVTLSVAAGYTFSGDYSNVSEIAGFTVNTIAPTTWTSNSGTQLVFKVTFSATGAAPTLATLTVGLTAGNAKVTVAAQTAEAGYDFYYNSSLATVAAPAYGAAIGTIGGAAAYTTPTDITGTNGTAIFVQVYKVETGGNTVVGFGEASATPTATPPTAVSWSNLTANGTSGTVTTTALTLTFDVNPSSLAIGDITVTGATKGALTGTGLTRTLTISAITVANGANVTVSITNPAGFTITPSSRTVAVNVATPASPTAPVITGPATMNLTEGYAATSTSAFTVTGTSPVTVAITAGDSRITWNNTAQTLSIAAGLTAGSYDVELTATNTAGTFVFTFTLTVEKGAVVIPPAIMRSITIVPATNGSVTSNKLNAATYETVTLNILPDEEYAVDVITVWHSQYFHAVPVSFDTNGTFVSFPMPPHNITVTVTFRDLRSTGIDDIQSTGLKAYAENGVLYVSGIADGATLRVYTVLGNLIYQSTTPYPSRGGELFPSSGGAGGGFILPGRGVYIVTDGHTVVKINN